MKSYGNCLKPVVEHLTSSVHKTFINVSNERHILDFKFTVVGKLCMQHFDHSGDLKFLHTKFASTIKKAEVLMGNQHMAPAIGRHGVTYKILGNYLLLNSFSSLPAPFLMTRFSSCSC